ncbi:hypothetical protein KFK09_004513 [Dendrobium nobile]|uniref:Uncharacterized protein n=1 Tax=Dendrobium nobile TaxID=94219 RepID=A0A8T3C0J5_DENNO|nr:hypothetical protein KFK09_004513 [Dendrobium nobile]
MRSIYERGKNENPHSDDILPDFSARSHFPLPVSASCSFTKPQANKATTSPVVYLFAKPEANGRTSFWRLLLLVETVSGVFVHDGLDRSLH